MTTSFRKKLPAPVRKVGGCALHYAQRLGRWAIVLRQVRGVTFADECRLLVSAALAPLTSLARLSLWQDPVLLFDISVRAKGIGVFRLRRRTDDLWHVLPSREHEIHELLERVLRPGNTFIDAGANIGVYTILASRLVGSRGRVIAVEMMPETAALLRRHVVENGCDNVEIVEKALSSQSGEIVRATLPVGKHGQASIASAEPTGPCQSVNVETCTLDEVACDLNRIDLLKLDLEGAEFAALSGARAVLERTGRVIYESHTNAEVLATLLQNAGFTNFRAFGKDSLAERNLSEEKA